MNSVMLPDDVSKQWEILLLLLSSEEKKIDRTGDSEVDTMSYFCNNEGIKKILLQWLKQMHTTYARKINELDTALKCDDVSLLWRQKGNDKFRANDVAESYKCYTKSVLYAKQNGPMYPLALANRSAALLRMKKFKECLSDVALALDSGYPYEQRHKLLLRQADCCIELNQLSKAQDALRAAADHAGKLDLSPAGVAEFDRHIKLLERKLEPIDVTRDKLDEDVLPGCYKGENPSFVAASKVLELRRSESAGRYVTTTEEARRGDVLFSEAPYAWVALPNGEAVCEYCCGDTINILPCSTCSRSVYCSAECRARAADLFHRWECVGAQSNLFPTVGIAHLALRVLIITAEAGFPPVPCSKPEPTTAAELFRSYANVDDIEIYKRDMPPFYRMFNLVTNFDKMNNMDYIQYALTATLLTLYLEHFTTFFDYLPSRLPYPLPARELKLAAAALVLRSMGQLVCNGHAALGLATVDDDDGRTVTEREVRRATAIYPSAAMMNHSCDPNIINTFYKCRLIIRCSRELSAGTEVLNCYGPHRAREPAAHRRAQLRHQYMFNCDCAACTDTSARDFVLVFGAYACQSCKGPVVGEARRPRCQQCRAEFRLDAARAALEHADDLAAQAERLPSLSAKCERLAGALRVRQQVLHRHHAGLRAAADHLARMYADAGEFSKSVELIKQNIQSLEYQFGSFSVEKGANEPPDGKRSSSPMDICNTRGVTDALPAFKKDIYTSLEEPQVVAHELRKLADVMLERIINSPQNPDYRDWCLETHKIIKKAVQLMELNYGSWEPLVKRLSEQETLVATFLAESRTPESADCVHHNLHYNLKI